MDFQSAARFPECTPVINPIAWKMVCPWMCALYLALTNGDLSWWCFIEGILNREHLEEQHKLACLISQLGPFKNETWNMTYSPWSSMKKRAVMNWNHPPDVESIFCYTDKLWKFSIATENCIILFLFRFKMVIFHSYVEVYRMVYKYIYIYRGWFMSGFQTIHVSQGHLEHPHPSPAHLLHIARQHCVVPLSPRLGTGSKSEATRAAWRVRHRGGRGYEVGSEFYLDGENGNGPPRIRG